MAGAVGIVFGLCVLSFTAGAALMYVVLRRREEAQVPQVVPEPPAPAPVPEEQLELRWHAPEYDEKPIHRNPVVSVPSVLDEQPETVLFEPDVVAVEPEPEPPRGQSEFRQRYLRTFEAARRRGGAADN
jgi:hypothetical protein